MTEETKRFSSAYYYLAALVGVIVIFAGMYFFFPLPGKVSAPTQVTESVTANGVLMPIVPVPDSFYSTTSAQYVASLANELSTATTSVAQAQASFSIAVVSMAGYLPQGYAQLRAIAANESYPAYYRALAVEFMGDVFFNVTDRSPAFALQNIFVGTPYVSMIGSSAEPVDQQVFDGMKNLYLYSISISDSPVAEYRVAEWYVNAAQTATSSAAKAAAITSAEQYLKQGDAVFNQFTTQLWPAVYYAYNDAQWLQAFVKGEIAFLTNDPDLAASAGLQYARARTTLLTHLSALSSGVRPAFSVDLFWADLNYALFENHKPQTQARAQLVQDLLNEIVAIPSFQLYGFSHWLSALASSTSSVQAEKDYKTQIIELASTNASFAQLLRSLGWGL